MFCNLASNNRSVKFSDEEKRKIENISSRIEKFHSIKDFLFHLDEKYKNEIICRFLRDYNGNEGEVCNLLSELYGWREKHGINDVLEDPQYEEAYKIVTQHVLFKMHKNDKLGQPLTIVNCGPMVLKTIFQKVTVDQLFKTFFYYLEMNMKMIRETEDKTGSDILSIVSILDLEGISLYAYMYKPAFKLFEKAVSIYEKRFAGYVGKVYLLNVPWIYQFLWNIVSPILSEANRNKVIIIKEYSELFQFFDEDVIPEKYGGKCKCENEKNGCIPMPMNIEYDTNSKNSNENAYHLDIKAGEVKDMRINVVTGDKISYNVVCDFYDIKFCIKLITKEGKEVELLHPNRIDTSLEPYRGTFSIEEDGECVAIFDNTYSYFHSKSVYIDFYNEGESPTSPTNDSSLFN